jgi:hypothetical protein
MIDISKITDADVEGAACVDDLDAAIRPLMDKAGITTGDIAGICFSDVKWGELGVLGRLEAIGNWLAHEDAMKEGE